MMDPITFLSAGSRPKIWWDLWDGTAPSSCPLPCTITYTETRLLPDNSLDNLSMIDLTFSPEVLVTKTEFVNFSLSTLLSEVGAVFSTPLSDVGALFITLLNFTMKFIQ